MKDVLEGLAEFARDEVRGTLEGRNRYRSFSRGLWRKLGERGLLGMTVATERGGAGRDPRELAEALMVFSREGMDLGLTLSWIVHLALCCKSIEKYGTSEQKERLLPRMLSGEMVGAMATSEPGTGAHPRGMKTRAILQGERYLIGGSKVFITNAPVADVIVVLGVTGGTDDKQEITAFLVEGRKMGMEVVPMELEFINTSPHGEIRFSSCELGRDAVLGNIGGGHNPISKSAFRRERALIICSLVGICEATANLVKERLLETGAINSFMPEETAAWIHHIAALGSFKLIARNLVLMAFGEESNNSQVLDLLIYMGMSLRKWASWIEGLLATKKVPLEFPLDILMQDLQLTQVGYGMLIKLGKRRFLVDRESRAQGDV